MRRLGAGWTRRYKTLDFVGQSRLRRGCHNPRCRSALLVIDVRFVEWWSQPRRRRHLGQTANLAPCLTRGVGRNVRFTFSDDQVIDAAMAQALHADMCRNHRLVAWAVMSDEPAYPERFTARVVTGRPCHMSWSARSLRRFSNNCRPAYTELGASRCTHLRCSRSGSQGRPRRSSSPEIRSLWTGVRLADSSSP